MDEPILVVRHTAVRWLTTTNHELFIFPSKLASVPRHQQRRATEQLGSRLTVGGSI